jgi:hypothetical protein
LVEKETSEGKYVRRYVEVPRTFPAAKPMPPGAKIIVRKGQRLVKNPELVAEMETRKPAAVSATGTDDLTTSQLNSMANYSK